MDGDGHVTRVIGAAQDITDRKVAEQKLLRHQDLLRSMAVKLTRAEEDLRREIAAGLHDRVGQGLAAVRMGIATLCEERDESRTMDELEGMLRVLDDVIGDTRRMTWQLVPPILYDLGLRPALGRLCEQMCKTVDCEISFACEEDSSGLSEAVATTIYRMARELLTNVAKHADASHVEVRLHCRNGQLELLVCDDGRGFEVSEAMAAGSQRGAYGLFSMRERLEALGGRLKIKSRVSDGSEVRVLLPAEDGQEICDDD
jgi:signal transduction histidine kinase